MRFDRCRTSGSAPSPLLTNELPGVIPGAVQGKIPDIFIASDPIYFDGPVTLSEFLESDASQNDLDMSPCKSAETFIWPVTSRFSFVSALTSALLAASLLCAPAGASDAKAELQPTDKENVRIASKTTSSQNADLATESGVVTIVCGQRNTLQAFAPIDLPGDASARSLPQGASPIAEMKYMPAVKTSVPPKAANKLTTTGGTPAKVDKPAIDHIYQRLLKLSLADPAVYNAEAPSLITYFSILTGGQDQKRVAELEKILERNLK